MALLQLEQFISLANLEIIVFEVALTVHELCTLRFILDVFLMLAAWFWLTSLAVE
jgi:hypothetical protein